MARFKFRLQPVLDKRSREERQQQMKVAELEKQRLELERQIMQCQRVLTAERESMRTQLGVNTHQVVDIEQIRLRANSSLRVTTQAQRAAVELAGVYKRLGSARELLKEKVVSRKAVQMLKSRQHERWQQDQNRVHNAAMDEIAMAAAARKMA